MIFIGFKDGTIPYTSFKKGNQSWYTTPTYGWNFVVDGVTVDASVKPLECYASVTQFNADTLTFNFDYDIENVRLFGKTSQKTGATTELTGATISANKRQVIVKNTTINTTLNGIYLMVVVNETGQVINQYDLTQNLTNCVSNLTGAKIEEQENKEIILTCNSNYIFDEIPTITIGDIVTDFIVSADKKSASITVNIDDNVIINADAVKDIRVYITGSIVNATCNYSDGELVKLGKNIIISAKAGYSFKGAYIYTYNGVTSGVSNHDTYLEIRVTEYMENCYLNDDYIATKEVEQVGTFVNLYKVTQSELTELSKKRIVIADGTVTDYGQFINSLYILPFNLPNDMLGDRTSIVLGNLDSMVESTLINTYMFEFVGGEIEVPLKYNNIYDFVNTECILHLPFLNKIYLNTEYVIGQTITLDFTVDLYSGSLTINVTSSFNNEIIASVKGLIGMNIPFIQKSNNSVINSVSNIYKNNIDRCFIEINRNIPYTKNSNVFGGAVVEYGRIGDYTGYLECDSLVLETDATNQEQEEIKNLLRNGVFI